ncbi:MAG: hypothetical protein M0P10_04370 [Sphaerochaetaceae bacterium]|nr:hypothetical protein [Sphaerochaetaceae bacterium]
MKKFITLFLLTTVLIAASFASSVNIFSTVEETPITASIAYNNTKLQDTEVLNIETTYTLDTEIAQSTDEFSVLVNGNTSDTETLNIAITASSFTNEYDFDSGVIPVPIATSGNAFDFSNSTFTQSIDLPSDVYTDTVVSTFTFNWDGKSELPNGTYTSSITIEIINAN